MMVKRMMAFLLVVALILPLYNAYAEDSLYSPDEVRAFNHTVELLKAMRVLYEDDVQEMATTITKGDFLKYALRLFTGGNMNINNNNYMEFVPLLGINIDEISLNFQKDVTCGYAVRLWSLALGILICQRIWVVGTILLCK